MKFLFTLIISLFISSSIASALPSNLEFTDLNKTKIDVQAGSDNDRLVVFWATWCEVCKVKLRKVLPGLSKEGGLEVITINTDEELERAQSYVKRKKVKLKVYRGPTSYLQQLKLSGVPSWAFYSRTDSKQKWVLKKASMGFDLKEINKLRNK